MKRFLVPAVAAVVGFALAALIFTRLPPGAPLPAATTAKPVRLLTISAVIDGSDRFIFSTNEVRLEHYNWQPPTDVIFDGQPWNDLTVPPAGWPETAAKLDLRKAAITQRNGRDVIALEHTEEGFDLYFSDTQGGSAPFVVTIAIPEK